MHTQEVRSGAGLALPTVLLNRVITTQTAAQEHTATVNSAVTKTPSCGVA